MIVYFLKNTKNGKTYVVATHGDYLIRIRAHLNRYHMRDSDLSLDIKEYGKESFEHGVLFECSNHETAASLEKSEIEKIPDGMRYNRIISGLPKLSTTRSESVRKSRVGKPRADETKKKISAAKKGVSIWGGKRIFSNETIAKMQEARNKMSLLCEQNGKIYQTVAKAAEDLGIKRGSIYRVVSGSRRSVYGYTFKIL